VHVDDHRQQQRVRGQVVECRRPLETLQQVRGLLGSKRLGFRPSGTSGAPLGFPVPAVDEVLDLAGGEAAYLDDLGTLHRGGLVAFRARGDHEAATQVLPDLGLGPGRNLGAIFGSGDLVESVQQDQAPPIPQLLLEPSRGLALGCRAKRCPQQGGNGDGRLGEDGSRVVRFVLSAISYNPRSCPGRTFSLLLSECHSKFIACRGIKRYLQAQGHAAWELMVRIICH